MGASGDVEREGRYDKTGSIQYDEIRYDKTQSVFDLINFPTGCYPKLTINIYVDSCLSAEN